MPIEDSNQTPSYFVIGNDAKLKIVKVTF